MPPQRVSSVSPQEAEIWCSWEDLPPQQLPSPRFKASKDGYDPVKFHAECDDIGPCFVHARANNGYSFGGRTSLSFGNATPGTVLMRKDPSAYLFRTMEANVFNPKKFAPKDASKAVHCLDTFGPTFGDGPDLFLFNQTKNATSATCAEKAFTTGGPLAGAANGFTLVEVEVYALNDFARKPSPQKLLADPFITTPITVESHSDILSFLRKYRPPEGVRTANILLAGMAGAGKSAFVGTADSAAEGELSEIVETGAGCVTLTKRLFKHTLEGTCIRLWDVVGWTTDNYKQGELMYLLDGNLPHKCDMTGDLSPGIQGYVSSPTLADRVHAIILVVPADQFKTPVCKTRMKELLEAARKRNIRSMMVITKIDLLGENLRKEDVFRSVQLNNLRHDAKEDYGIPPKNVFPVKNYYEETQPDFRVELPVLIALKKAVQCCKGFFAYEESTEPPPSYEAKPTATKRA